MEDTFDEEPFQAPRQSPRYRQPVHKSSSAYMGIEANHQRQNERLRREVSEKDAQIERLSAQVTDFKEGCQRIRDLILELELATGTEFLTSEQRKNIANMPHNEGILVIKKAMNHLIAEYNQLPEIFANEFESKANILSEQIEEAEKEGIEIITERQVVERKIKVLDRIIKINSTEKESLKKYANSLQESIDEQSSASKQAQAESNSQLSKLKKEIQVNVASSNQQEAENLNLVMQINVPMTKGHKDMLKEDEELTEELNKLKINLSKEKSAHELTKSELEFTKGEIERAKQTILKYKQTVSVKTMKEAKNTNKDLRMYITDQREEQRRKLFAQKKKNKDLERQINEMLEEQSMLAPYLVQMEKKLQAEMLKLPSLNDMHNRNENEPRRALTRLNKREMEDAEMKTVKRAITRIKAKRVRAKTAIGK